MLEVGQDQILLIGFSRNLLERVDLPDGSVLVVEEPDVIRKRNLNAIVAQFPAVSSLAACRYQDAAEFQRLIDDEPRLRAAQAVVPGVEYAVTPASQLAARFGLPGAGLRAGRALRDKHELRLIAASAGLGNPEFLLVESPEEVRAFMARIGDPCVLKPTGRQASLGVEILASAGEIGEAWDRCNALDEGDAAPDRGIPSRLMVERVVRGDEYSVEMLVAGGDPRFANVTAKEVLGGPRPIETAHVVPAPVSPEVSATLIESTSTLARAASFGSGILHGEWIVNAEGCFLVECAARLPGDEIPGLIAAAYEFEFAESYLRCLLGQRPSCPAAPAKAAAISFLTASDGRVLAVTGLEAAAASPGVVDVSVEVVAGDAVRAPRSSWDRIGYVMAVGANPQEAQRAARHARDLILVEVGDLVPAVAGRPERL